jgi:hypothetical protein
MNELIKPKFLSHRDGDVTLVVINFISEITRITSHVGPSNDDLMRKLFQITVE